MYKKAHATHKTGSFWNHYVQKEKAKKYRWSEDVNKKRTEMKLKNENATTMKQNKSYQMTQAVCPLFS